MEHAINLNDKLFCDIGCYSMEYNGRLYLSRILQLQFMFY